MVGLSFFENKMWKGLGMNEDQMERLVKSFEHLAETLGDLCVIQKRRYDRDYPEQRKPREAVTSHVKTEEDLAKERQGDTDEPIREWLGGFEDEGFIGEREKAFLEEEKQRNAKGETTWRTIDSATSVTPFVLADADGECLVGPINAEITPTSRDVWYGDSPSPGGPPVASRGFMSSDLYRYNEQLLHVGDQLSVTGELRSNSEIETIAGASAALLRQWKSDQ